MYFLFLNKDNLQGMPRTYKIVQTWQFQILNESKNRWNLWWLGKTRWSSSKCSKHLMLTCIIGCSKKGSQWRVLLCCGLCISILRITYLRVLLSLSLTKMVLLYCEYLLPPTRYIFLPEESPAATWQNAKNSVTLLLQISLLKLQSSWHNHLFYFNFLF